MATCLLKGGPQWGGVGHAGVGWVMQGRVRGHTGVGWVMQGWDESCRGGWVEQGWGGSCRGGSCRCRIGHTGVGHVGVQ